MKRLAGFVIVVLALSFIILRAAKRPTARRI